MVTPVQLTKNSFSSNILNIPDIFNDSDAYHEAFWIVEDIYFVFFQLKTDIVQLKIEPIR